jgi:hypothetical protein
MKRLLIAISLTIAFVSACAANAPVVVRNPTISGYMMSPVNANQCEAVRMNFTLTNQTDTTFFSQRPYSGSGYNLYQSFADIGLTPLPDRYMIGVSLNAGGDGYPYRWGFRGALLSGRTTAIQGALTIVEVGTYQLTAALLKGGVPVDGRTYNAGTVTVSPCTYIPPPPPRRPMRGRPVYPVINGQYGYPPMVPYVINGYNYFPAQQFLFTIGGNVYIEGPSVLINVPGYQLAMVPGLDYGYLNGMPIYLPMPLYSFNGVPYITPSVLMPLFGNTMSWDPYGRQLFINSPWMQGY